MVMHFILVRFPLCSNQVDLKCDLFRMSSYEFYHFTTAKHTYPHIENTLEYDMKC